ncbi:ABC transporter substrate-binding protein [Streptomyces sp. SID4956]|uniref:ABC transporter substrate-binding protein n=1 Tax=Streptomyces sp. SID4956 TaxID=2690290 RepID=UPI00136CC8E4|nr:ABC transporter substrate-binding protein [Streptomyces sp. SID4956]
MSKDRRRNRHTARAALAAGAVFLAAACGSGADDTGESGAAADTVALPTKKATGDPVVVGYINNDSSPLGSYVEVTEAVKAAVEYINNNRGGIGGRPIELAVCSPNGSAASSANCVAELLQKKPAAVIGGLDLGSDGSLPALAKAKVPYLSSFGIGGAEYASPNSYSFFGGSIGAMSGGAAYAADELGTKKAAVLFNETPQARLVAKTYVEKVLNEHGVKDVSLVAYGANETDMAGPLSQALKGGTDTVIGIMQGSGCTSVMQAKQSLGSDAKFMFPGSCADPKVLKAGGAGAEGVYFPLVQLAPDAEDDEVAEFRAAMAKYAPKAQVSSFAQGAFATAVTLSTIMAKASDPTSPSAVTEALSETHGQSSFTGPDVTCDRKQIDGLPALCTDEVRMVQNEGGKHKDLTGRWYAP